LACREAPEVGLCWLDFVGGEAACVLATRFFPAAVEGVALDLDASCSCLSAPSGGVEGDEAAVVKTGLAELIAAASSRLSFADFDLDAMSSPVSLGGVPPHETCEVDQGRAAQE
jgi:hypothetical protein